MFNSSTDITTNSRTIAFLTLKNIYQHLSHAERLQPLQEVLRRFYEADLSMEDDDESLSRLKSVLSELSPHQQLSIKQFLDDIGAA